MLATRSLLVGLAATAMMTTAAAAADWMSAGGADPIYDSGLFNFEGFYVGGTAGVASLPAPGMVGTVGGVAGANFVLTDALIAGVEFQGDTLWNGSGFVGFDTLFLGKLGGYVMDNMVAYATAGGGLVDGSGAYGLGAGIEMAVADQLSVRGEAMALGNWGVWPDGGKAAIGVLWHMN